MLRAPRTEPAIAPTAPPINQANVSGKSIHIAPPPSAAPRARPSPERMVRQPILSPKMERGRPTAPAIPPAIAPAATPPAAVHPSQNAMV